MARFVSSFSRAPARPSAPAPISSGWDEWQDSPRSEVDDASEMARMFQALDRLPVPVIGRVHGAALGGGAGLAAICDIVVAAENTLFGFTEVEARG